MNFGIIINNGKNDQIYDDCCSLFDKYFLNYPLYNNLIFRYILKKIIEENLTISVNAVTYSGKTFETKDECNTIIIEKILKLNLENFNYTTLVNKENIFLFINTSIYDKKDLDIIFIKFRSSNISNFFTENVRKEQINYEYTTIGEEISKENIQNLTHLEDDIYNAINHMNIPSNFFFELLYHLNIRPHNTLINEFNKSISIKSNFNEETKKLDSVDECLLQTFNDSINIVKQTLEKANIFFMMEKFSLKMMKMQINDEMKNLESLEKKCSKKMKSNNLQQYYSEEKNATKQKTISEITTILIQRKDFLTKCLNKCNIFSDKHTQYLNNFIIEIDKTINAIKEINKKDIYTKIRTLIDKREDAFQMVKQNYEIINGKKLISTIDTEQDKLQDEFLTEVEAFSNIVDNEKKKFNFINNNQQNIIENSKINLQKINDIDKNLKYIISCKTKIEKLIANHDKFETASKLKDFLSNL